MTAAVPFVTHTAESAPEGARRALAAARERFGAVPTPLALLANSPTALTAFELFTKSFAQSALGALEREVVIMVVATQNACEICVAMHTRTLRSLRLATPEIDALREGRVLSDPRLEALRSFTRCVMQHRGEVPDAAMQRFLDEGFTPENALDVVVGVAAYTLSTYANRLTRAPLDSFLERDRWSPVRTLHE